MKYDKIINVYIQNTNIKEFILWKTTKDAVALVIAEMEEEKITIDRDYVKETFEEKIHPDDLDRFIL